MKKASLLLLIFISLTAFTCENESIDENIEIELTNPNDPTIPTDPTNPTNPTNPSDPTSIVGTWRAVSLEGTMELTSSIPLAPVSTITFDASNVDYLVAFADNNTFSTNGSYTLNTTFTVPGIDPLSNSQVYDDVSGTGDYEVMGNILIIGGSFYNLELDGVDTSAIANQDQELQYTLSADGQTLTMIQDQEEVVSQGGITSTTTINATSTYTRE